MLQKVTLFFCVINYEADLPIHTFFHPMSIVILFVDTLEEKVSTERRFDKGLTIAQLKVCNYL